MTVTPRQQIRARYDAETVTVYQAYSPVIGQPATALGRFPDWYDRQRMTWIKPSFRWMMYRSGWATKPGQEHVLAIRIRRDGFDWALANSALSSYEHGVHPDREAWRRTLRAPVRIQWDPERDLRLRPLPHRTIQIGLSGAAVARYVDEWTVDISDVTGLCRRIQARVSAGDLATADALLPVEQPYPQMDLSYGIAAAQGGQRE